MNENNYDDAVLIVKRAFWNEAAYESGVQPEAIVAALARAGWLHDPSEVAALRAGRDALLQACDTVEQLAMSERDMALDTDDIRSLLTTATLDGQPVPADRP